MERDFEMSKIKRTRLGEFSYEDYANLVDALSHRDFITMNEATVLYGIGRDHLQRIVNKPDVDFIAMLGKRKLICREKFKEYVMAGKAQL